MTSRISHTLLTRLLRPLIFTLSLVPFDEATPWLALLPLPGLEKLAGDKELGLRACGSSSQTGTSGMKGTYGPRPPPRPHGPSCPRWTWGYIPDMLIPASGLQAGETRELA